ncbi:hypothetical protein [Streptomyces sp. NPDC090135]|uniref:hypothetical protein n=1 Tax=Streptomyces sp. NPDC090135 TaxID=3365957 RepID=UPI00381CB398
MNICPTKPVRQHADHQPGWKTGRPIAWLFGYRRLTVRYGREGSHFLAFLGLTAALTCYKKLTKLTM